MILGIDPGLANIGWAVLKDEKTLVKCGCLTTRMVDANTKRLGKIYEELEKIIKKFEIEEMALETLFFAKNVKSAMMVAEVIGVIKICGEKNKIRVFGYTPLQIKMALVGYGRAEKEQVETMVRSILNLEEGISPSHASDAVATALTHFFTNQELRV
ncbi:MAG: crossover junction endodeoxyribonuclease RuvC [Candidatus Shapirobacteria bacterium]|nr:crossover junction endodeoxyribonuclease RuvC [Candidatus Shapirobacteria bacterium]